MAFGNKPANTSNQKQEYDKVVNLGLFCSRVFEKEDKTMITLSCSKARKKSDGTYTAGIYFDVVITQENFEKTGVEGFDPDAAESYAGSLINVDGSMYPHEYTPTGSDAPVGKMRIYPTRVEKVQR